MNTITTLSTLTYHDEDDDKTLFLTARECLRYFGDSPLPRSEKETPRHQPLQRLLRLLRR